MLQLIDQVNPNRLVFRCTECQHKAVSTHSRGLDGFFEAVLPDGRVQYQRHVCDPATLERLREAAERAATPPVQPRPKRRTRKVDTEAVRASLAPARISFEETPNAPTPKRRGRPRKVVPTTT